MARKNQPRNDDGTFGSVYNADVKHQIDRWITGGVPDHKIVPMLMVTYDVVEVTAKRWHKRYQEGGERYVAKTD